MLNGFTSRSDSVSCICKMFTIQLPFPQKAKPLSLEESFKLLQDQEKRQKVGTCVTIGLDQAFN